MKVHAFKLETAEGSQKLTAVLRQVEGEKRLRDRIRIINTTELRAEEIEHRSGVWLLDFVRIRTSDGPGRVGRNRAVKGFEFDAEEGFGEETAALYDPAANYMLVQYNHWGIRAGAIGEYLSLYTGSAANGYFLYPKYDETVERKRQNQGLTRRLTFAIDMTKMTQGDRARGVALSEALDYGREAGADRIKVEIAVGGTRRRGLGSKARAALDQLLRISGDNPDAVTKLEVAGKQDVDGVTEVLDLLTERLTAEFDDLTLGPDLRFSREQRWGALLRARNGWKDLLKR